MQTIMIRKTDLEWSHCFIHHHHAVCRLLLPHYLQSVPSLSLLLLLHGLLLMKGAPRRVFIKLLP